MSRWVGIILLIAFAVGFSGAGESLHVHLEHAHEHDLGAYDDRSAIQSKAAHSDAADCNVCLGLHAPLDAWRPQALGVLADSAVRTVLLLQSQRLDAALVYRRLCRGPPMV